MKPEVTINSGDVWGRINISKLKTEEFKNNIKVAIKKETYPQGIVQRAIILQKIEEERIKVLEELLRKKQNTNTKKSLELSLLLSRWSLSKLNQVVNGHDSTRGILIEEPMEQYWNTIVKEERKELSKRDGKLFKLAESIKNILK